MINKEAADARLDKLGVSRNKRERLLLLLLLLLTFGALVTWGVKWGTFYMEKNGLDSQTNQAQNDSNKLKSNSPAAYTEQANGAGNIPIKNTSPVSTAMQQTAGTGGQETNSAEGALNKGNANLRKQDNAAEKSGGQNTSSSASDGSMDDAAAGIAHKHGHKKNAAETQAASTDMGTGGAEKNGTPPVNETADNNTETGISKDDPTNPKYGPATAIAFTSPTGVSCDANIIPTIRLKNYGNIVGTRFLVKYTGDVPMTSVQIVLSWCKGDKTVTSQIVPFERFIHKNDNFSVDAVNIPKDRKSWNCIRYTIQFSNEDKATETEERTQCWP